jgi:cytochrome c556
MKRLRYLIAVMVMAVMGAGIVYAKFDRADDAIRYRQAVMTIIGEHFGRMAAVVKGSQAYGPAQFENNAAVVAMLSKLPWEAVMYPGSDQGKTTLSSKALKDRDGLQGVPQ